MQPHFDAQSALAFMVAQAATIEATVYRTQYQEIQYNRLVPVDTTANPWTPSVIYYSSDMVGRMEWFSAKADDVPRADVTRAQHTTAVRMAAIGYGYDVEEVAIAQLLGQNLPADKANAARRASEEHSERIVLYGDAAVGFKGLLNNDGVTAGDVADGAGAADTTWPTKTPDEILNDVNSGLTGIFTGSANVLMANTILLPYDRMLHIATRRLNDLSETTILQWLLENNVLTRTRGEQLTIRGVMGLETAGADDDHRMVIYRNDPETVKLHLPMPFRFWPVMQDGPLKFVVPGTKRIGGVDIKQPAAFRYLDAI